MGMELLYKLVVPNIVSRDGRFRREFIWENLIKVNGVPRANEPCPRFLTRHNSYHRLGHLVEISDVKDKTLFVHNTYTVFEGNIEYNSKLRGYIDENDVMDVQYVMVNTFGISGLAHVDAEEGTYHVKQLLLEMWT